MNVGSADAGDLNTDKGFARGESFRDGKILQNKGLPERFEYGSFCECSQTTMSNISEGVFTGRQLHYNERFMPNFRIHRMKDAPRQNFRFAPHVSGAAQVKPKDYEPEVVQIEAQHEYAAWTMMRATPQPLAVGDLLESEAGELRICKYVGFEKADWLIPEPAPQANASN
jgi:hypothetical protein